MIVLRANPRVLSAVASCVIALFVGAGARAQAPEALPAPQPLAPTPLHQARDRAAAAPADELPAGGVRVERLGDISRQAIGLPDIDRTQFGLDLWRGTSQPIVETLLPRLPARMRSPAMQALARRLLLTAAEPPSGVEGTGSLVAIRIERLLAMGELDGAQELLARAPASDDPLLAESAVRLHFLGGDPASACNIIRGRGTAQADTFWQQVLIACQALAGQRNEALFGLNLLREQDGAVDPTFQALVERVAGMDAPAPDPLHLTAVNFALLQATDGQATDGQAANGVDAALEPALARVVSGAATADADARLAAAHDAATLGALDPQALPALYQAVAFTDDERANPLTAATAIGGPRALALLYLEAQAQTIPAARAEVLRHLVELARAQGDGVLAARLIAPLLTPAGQVVELAWFAPIAARILLGAGDGEGAVEWYRTLNPSLGGETAQNRAALWPLLRVALGDGGSGLDRIAAAGAGPAVVSIGRGLRWQPNSLADWRAVQESRSPETAADRAASLLSVLTALDEPLGEGDLLAMADAEPQPQTAMLPVADMWFGLARAAGQDRVGETVLRALVILGDEGPSGIHPIVLHQVVASLTRVGLQSEARALALEALLAAGL